MKMYVTLVVTLLINLAGSSVNAQSVRDHLDSRGVDSSFTNRAKLWYQLYPNEKYTGTAQQNTKLLESLKRNESSPEIVLLDNVVSANDRVRVRTEEGKKVLFETELSAKSFESTGGVVEIGKARTGVFLLRVTDGMREANAQIFISPTDGGKLEVFLIFGTSKSQTEGLTPLSEPDESTLSAFEKFLPALTKDRFRDAAKKAGPIWVAENAAGLSTSFVACTVWPVTCLPSGGAHGLDLATSILIQAATDMPQDVLSMSEKAIVVNWMKGANALAQLGIAVRTNEFKKRSCTIANAGLDGLNSLSAEIEHNGARIVVRVFIQEANKVVLLACRKD